MKTKKIMFVAGAFILALYAVVSVSEAATTDTNVNPRPVTPPTFGADHKTVDPTFGSTIFRVTGPVGSNALRESVETQNLAPIQHFHNPWSLSGNHFLVWANRLSEGGPARIDLYEIERNSFNVSRVKSVASPVASMNYERGVHFSHFSELIVYAVDTIQNPQAIKRCNLSNIDAYEGLIANNCENMITDSAGIHQMTQSDDDRYFSWYTDNRHVKVWDRTTKSLVFDLDTSSWYSFDESQMAPNGKWVFVKGKRFLGDNKALVYEVADISNVKTYSGLSTDYFAGKHSGYSNKWVNETSEFSNYRLVVRDISIDSVGESPWAGGTPRFAFQHLAPLSKGGTIHPSYSNSNYIYGGFFRSAGLPSPWVPYMDEIVRIKDDGTEVTRLAHAWSNFYSNSYDEIPCYASPAGDYVLFYSNWNGTNSASRHDVFIVSTGSTAPMPPKAPVGLIKK